MKTLLFGYVELLPLADAGAEAVMKDGVLRKARINSEDATYHLRQDTSCKCFYVVTDVCNHVITIRMMPMIVMV